MVALGKTRKMCEFCEITSSKRIYAADYQPDGIPFYRSKEIIEKQQGNRSVSTELFISEKKFNEIKVKFGVPKPGDVLLTSVGTLGVPYVLKNNDRFYFKDGNLTWFRNFNGLDSRYLYYWLLSPKGKAELNKCKIGASQPALTIALLKNMKIDILPIQKQQKVAAVFSAYDDLIENNNRRIKILEEMVQTIYNEWFVKFRFPGHSKVKMVDSELGKIPEGWKRNLKDFVDFLEGPGLRNWQYRNEGIPFLNIRTLVGSDIDFSKINYLDADEVEKKYKHFLLSENDHVVSSSGTIGRLVTIRKCHLPLMLNTSIIRMRPKMQNLGKWQLKHFLKSDYFQHQAKSFASGVAQMNFGPFHLNQMWILAPSEKIGLLYEEIVAPLEEQIKILVDKNRVLRQTRDLLLHKLISGEIDVEHLDIKTEDIE